MKIIRKLFYFTFISLIISPILFSTSAKGANFDPGRIIDNAIFNNKSSMSVSDIQNFLNSKVSSCDTNHSATVGGSGTTYSSPFICLKDYYEDGSNTYTVTYGYTDTTGSSQTGSRTYPVNNYFRYTSLTPIYNNGDYRQGYVLRATIQNIGGARPNNSTSAAQIIYNAAQNYGINPQVLIVTLQKENGLITDTWPYPWQYLTATGFGCPDTAPCDSSYYGFTNQLNQLARHMRNFYDLNPAWYIPFRPGINIIPYSPIASCGGSSVNIQNNATSALYSYTPYQPNAAALNNMYGNGDGCSSYGNRNFWRYFTDWFGSTTNPYQWQPAGQSISGNPVVGQKFTWSISAKNTGTATWYNTGNNPVRLGTANTTDRTSSFCTNGWVSCNRPATLTEASVAPGEVGTFTFEVQAPSVPNTYLENFSLVVEGVSWMNDPGLNFYPIVSPGTFFSSIISDTYSKTMYSGQISDTVVTMKNTGNTYWYNTGNYPVYLGTDKSQNRTSSMCMPSWTNCARPALLTESVVPPGGNGTFTFSVKYPDLTSYTDSYRLVAERLAWFGDQIINTTTQVDQPPTLNSLSSTQSLDSGQILTSDDGRYKLVMQSDGNLVIYSPIRAIWSSGTFGNGTSKLVFQSDGNLVVYRADSSPTWNSYTMGRPSYNITMQSDGNLVIYDKFKNPIWSSNTYNKI